MTGDEDGFVKMWDNRQGDTSIMTFKRFNEFVSSSLKMDEHHLITASGDLRDLRQKKPDIQSEMHDELRGDRQEWDQAGGGQGIGPLYLLR